jgi:hypothetical protein
LRWARHRGIVSDPGVLIAVCRSLGTHPLDGAIDSVQAGMGSGRGGQTGLSGLHSKRAILQAPAPSARDMMDGVAGLLARWGHPEGLPEIESLVCLLPLRFGMNRLGSRTLRSCLIGICLGITSCAATTTSVNAGNTASNETSPNGKPLRVDGGTTRVQFDPDPERLQLEMQSDGDWRVLCRGPCVVDAERAALLRVSGYGIKPTDPFPLPTEPSQLRLQADRPQRYPGIGWAAVGMAAVGGVGLAAGLVAGVSDSDARPEERRAWPTPVGIASGALMITGVSLGIIDLFINPPWRSPAIRIEPVAGRSNAARPTPQPRSPRLFLSEQGAIVF